ncbi:MAG: universal stress protein [Alphaproteobacteria bacterium]|nr:universal stress protein [Alphaproteobacteria bacterium]
MIKTLIVPTDGSEHADKAVELAADLADKYKARLLILHSLLRGEPMVGLRSLCERLNAPADLIAKLEAEAERTVALSYAEVPVALQMTEEFLDAVGQLVCDRARAAAEKHGATDVDVKIVDGVPADAVLAAAKHENADMIVMGSRGLGRLEGFLLGAVSQRVNHLATCTCITVK